ncbi:MAG: hypothetical protein JO182_18135 [Acidobacteriaceae bacterium]|nr:hypothetical protein [Acidobacteriaceae bacterium]MBV9036413.1 hypothetical protein [Acidobacteriaceae bacterium]
MSLIEGGLEIADDFLEDAVGHLQLLQFSGAVESLQNASQAMDLVERYLPNVSERDQVLRYQTSVTTARQRVQTLEQSITREDTKSH